MSELFIRLERRKKFQAVCCLEEIFSIIFPYTFSKTEELSVWDR